MSTSGGNWKDLLKASRVGDIPLIEYHLRSQVDPNYQHPEYFTSPVFECIRNGHVDALKVLIEKGGGSTTAPEDATDKTPLEVAIHERQHDIVDLLLSETGQLDKQRDVRPYFREVVIILVADVLAGKNYRDVDERRQSGSLIKDLEFLDDIMTTGILSFSVVFDVARAILDYGHQVTIDVTVVGHTDSPSLASPQTKVTNILTTMENDLRNKTGNKKIFVQINGESCINRRSSSRSFCRADIGASVVIFDNPNLHGDESSLLANKNDDKTGSDGRYIVIVDHLQREASSTSSTHVSDLLHDKKWSAVLLNDKSSMIWPSSSTSFPHLLGRIAFAGYNLVSTLFSFVVISLTWLLMLQAHQEEKRKKPWVETVAWMVSADEDVYMNEIGGRIHRPDSAQMYLDRIIKNSRENEEIILF